VLENGVKIIEQNWSSADITVNGNQPLTMNVSEGKFSIEDRDDFWVIGWVSRTKKNPGKYFLFLNGNSEGWYPERYLFTEKENSDGFKVKPRSRFSIIASPVFISNNSIKHVNRINMRIKIENKNGQKGMGFLSLRDKNGDWSKDIPFVIDVNNGFSVYSVSLANLENDFEITQIRLQINDKPQIGNEAWTINWIQIY